MFTQYKSIRLFATLALVITTQSCLLNEEKVNTLLELSSSSSSLSSSSSSSNALVPNQDFVITGTVVEAGTNTPLANFDIIVSYVESNYRDNAKLQKTTVGCIIEEPQVNAGLAKNTVACVTPPTILGTYSTDSSGAFSVTVPQDGIYYLTINKTIEGRIYSFNGSIEVIDGKSEPLSIVIEPFGTEPKVCNDLFAPVCGSDGFTYSNECYATRAGITKFTEGSCPNPNPTCETVDCAQGYQCVDVMPTCKALTPECLNPIAQCIPN